MYFLCGVSDVGLGTNDTSLLLVLVRLYRDLVDTKMYVTYGIGSVHQWEGFGDSYDLPNDSAYCETCASIGLVFLTHRILQWDWNVLLAQRLVPGEVADVLEGALYNAVGAGVSIDGRGFLYVNPLETTGKRTRRSEWFDTSCCPPNVARLFCSLGGYSLLVRNMGRGGKGTEVAVVLYMNCTAEVHVDGAAVKIIIETGWPWDGKVVVRFENAQDVEIALRLRIPKWAEVSVQNISLI